jgi:hypothetical protein
VKRRCTPSDYRRISRWEHEHVLEAMQRRLDQQPDAMTLRRSTIEHVFGSLKHWMGTTYFLMRELEHAGTPRRCSCGAATTTDVMDILASGWHCPTRTQVPWAFSRGLGHVQTFAIRRRMFRED